MMVKNDLLKAVWERNRTLLLTVVVLAVLSFAFLLYQQLQVNTRLLDLRLQQTRLQLQLRQQEATLAGRGARLSEAQQVADDLKRFQALLPDKKQFSEFLGDLFSWAQKSHLSIKQIKYTPKSDKKTGFLRYSLSFSLSGEYAQIKKFIHLLENSPRLLIVERIALSGSGSSREEKPGVQLQIQLATYFREVGP